MKSLAILIAFFVFSISMVSQEIDSLQILKTTDWQTLGWLEKDTVILVPLAKIDTIYDGLTHRQKASKRFSNKYGERISFESGEMEYSDHAMCKVGSILRNINSFIFKNNKVVIEFKTKPWNGKEWTTIKREYKILKWSPKGIVLL